jgi:hypothetical protein
VSGIDRFDCARLLDLYVNQGLTLAAMGELLGITPPGVAYRMEQCGIPRRKGGAPTGVRRIAPPPREELRNMLRTGGGQVGVARRLGVDKKTVRSWLDEYGLPAVIGDDPAIVKEVLDRHSRQSAYRISIELGIAKLTVLEIIRRHGRPRTLVEAHQRRGPTREIPPRDLLRNAYERDELTLKELGRLFSANPATVRRWLVARAIPVRTPAESKQTSRYQEKAAAARRGEASHLYRGRLPTRYNELRRDYRWRQAARRAIALDAARCADCGEPVASASRSGHARENTVAVHHIVPRAFGGSLYSQRNLITLHSDCHASREFEIDRILQSAARNGWLSPAPHFSLTQSGRELFGSRASLIRRLTDPYLHLSPSRRVALRTRVLEDLDAEPVVYVDAEAPVRRERFRRRRREAPKLRLSGTCANPDCGAAFMTNRPRQIYCSERCRSHMDYVRAKARGRR